MREADPSGFEFCRTLHCDPLLQERYRQILSEPSGMRLHKKGRPFAERLSGVRFMWTPKRESPKIWGSFFPDLRLAMHFESHNA
jgi:hypothetical protein